MNKISGKSRLIQLIPVFLGLSTWLITPDDTFVAIISGVFASSVLTLPTHAFIRWINRKAPAHFNGAFYLLIAIRLLLAVVLLIAVLELTKITEIFFTVSFIISYLYQSVTETIFTEKNLVHSTKRKK